MNIQPKTKVRVAPWVLQRRKVGKHSKLGKARGVVVSVGDGPHGPDYARIKWSNDSMSGHWTNLKQVEIV